MTLNIKISKGIEYQYFQAGKTSLYIGPKGDPEKAKVENVIKALDYSRKREAHYMKFFDELLPLLPVKIREQYLAKEIAKLQDKITRYKNHRSKK